jgi:hypothetical protein
MARRAVPLAVTATSAAAFTLSAALVLAAAPAGRLSAGPDWLKDLAASDSTLLGVITLAALAALIWGLTRLLGRGRPSAAAGGVSFALLALTTLAFGVAGFYRCGFGASPFLSALANTLGLFVGDFNDVFSGDGTCPAGAPLAVTLARLTGLTTVLYAAGLVVVRVFADSLARYRVWRARSVTLVAGLEDDALQAVEREAAAHVGDRRWGLSFLAEEASDPGLLDLGRRLGAVYRVDWETPATVRRAVRRGDECRLTKVYLTHPDASQNLYRFDVLDQATRGLRRREGLGPVETIVRADDPWQAADWRHGRVADFIPAFKDPARQPWLVDTACEAERTAQWLADELADAAVIVLDGATPMALALAVELAWRDQEARVVAGDAATPPRRLVLTGDGAGRLAGDIAAYQRRFGPPVRIAAEVAPGDWGDFDGGGGGVAVVLAHDPPLPRAGVERRVGEHPGWRVYQWDEAQTAVAARPLVEGYWLFGPTLDLPPGYPANVWERIARVSHRVYLARFGQDLDPERETNRPWEALSPFWRGSNVRQVMTTLRNLAGLGYTWLPRREGPAQSVWPALTADQQLALAQLEHDEWSHYFRVNGWAKGERDDKARLHPSLIGWDELSRREQDKDFSAVQSCLETLALFGYEASPA